MQVDILTPDAHVFTGQAEVVTLPGIDGSFQVLEGHAPLVSILQRGQISVKTKTQELHFATSGGVAEVSEGKVSVLAQGIAS